MNLRGMAIWACGLVLLAGVRAEARPASGRRGEFTITRPKTKKPRALPPAAVPPPAAPDVPPPRRVHVRMPVRSMLVEIPAPPPPVELASMRVALGLGESSEGLLGRLNFEGEHWFDDGASELAVGYHASFSLTHGADRPLRHVELVAPQLVAAIPIAGHRFVAFAGGGPAYVGYRACANPLCGELVPTAQGWGLAGAAGAGLFFLPGDGAVHSVLLRVELLSVGGWSATIGYGVGIGGARKAVNWP